MSQRIMVVEDDASIVRTLRINLRARGYDVELCGDARSALDAVAAQVPDLVILDLGLPDRDGIEVLRAIRERSEVPVVVLTARAEADDKVEALDEGADDYVTKPFGMEELLARVRAHLRRSHTAAERPDAVVTDDFSLDFATFTALRDGREIKLTPTEWRILAALAQHRGEVIPHAQLLRAVWGPGYGNEANYLRVYTSQLRHKLEADPARPRHLLTHPGVGYRLA